VKKDIKIAVSGKSGCGNTTVSKLVASRLGIRFVNFTFRSLAQETGISLRDVLDMAAKDDGWDKEVDNRQLQLARASGGCVLGSRLAIWKLEEADVKVYLRAKAETRAERILNREGDATESPEFTAERDRQDHNRYLRIYNLDNDDYSFADIVIDTDDLTAEQTADIIVKAAMKVS